MILNRRTTLLATAVLSLSLLGCASGPAPANVADTVARTPQLSSLNKLLNDSGLAETLRSAGPYTLFAPSDEAFKALPAKTLAELAANPARLKALLGYHVLDRKIEAAEVKPGNVKSVQGGNIALSRAGTFVTVEDAVVLQPDVPATNGVIHVIDRVLTPPRS